MKKKIHKILGIGLTLVLALALVGGFALPVASSPAETLNEWYNFEYPVQGELGGWFMDSTIDGIGPMARAINDDVYAYTELGVTDRLFKSTDGARSWAATAYELIDLDPTTTAIDPPGAIVDMVCSSIDEDIIYVTDGNYVYKSSDGGDTWIIVGRDSLEKVLEGACGTDITGLPITCLDVGYGPDDAPYVFIGVTYTDTTVPAPSDGEPSVLYMNEEGFPAQWTDLELHCWHGPWGGYVPYSVGACPDFVDSKQVMVVATVDDDITIAGVDPRTYVVSTTGVACSWNEVSELLKDCIPATDLINPGNFQIQEASRIAFPDDWEDTETLFVGVTGQVWEFGGDVYMATVTSPVSAAQDMNVAGIWSGCVGKVPATNIISLDIYGDTDSASLIAGVYGYVDSATVHLFNESTDVYCSSDGGWSWDVSTKDPTGGDFYKNAFRNGRVEALWYGDWGLAATSGCECAVSLCCGEDYPCEFFSQISLIATDITCVVGGDHSPEYLSDTSSTMYMLTNCKDCCLGGSTFDTQSLFRHDGTYWERVFCSTISGATEDPAFEMVEVSPDFDATSAVYLFNDHLEGWRTTDAGCGWDKLTFPCVPRPFVSAGVVIDEDTVIAGGASPDDGWIFKTTRHGARPWKAYEMSTTIPKGDAVSFDLEPGYEDPGYVLYGDDNGRVWLSEDGGETWELVGSGALAGCRKVLGTNDVWVVFDPGFNTAGDDGENTIYAAAGDNIARCTIDWDEDIVDQEWVKIGGETGDIYLGIETKGDTALYVTAGCIDGGYAAEPVTVTGTIEVECGCDRWGTIGGWTYDVDIVKAVVEEISGHFIDGELVSIIEYNLECFCPEGSVSGVIGLEGYDSGAIGAVDIAGQGITVDGVMSPGEWSWQYSPKCAKKFDLYLLDSNSGYDAYVMSDGEYMYVAFDYASPNMFAAFNTYKAGAFTPEKITAPVINYDGTQFWDTLTDLNADGDFLDTGEYTRVSGAAYFESSIVGGHTEFKVPLANLGLEPGDDIKIMFVLVESAQPTGYIHPQNAAGNDPSGWDDYRLDLPCGIGYVVSSFLRASGGVYYPTVSLSGVMRSLNPLDDVKPTMKVVFERLIEGLTAGSCLKGLAITSDVSDEGCAENVLWTLDSTVCKNVWVYEDTTAQPVIAVAPLDERKLGVTDTVTLEWEELCGVECYEVSLFKYCAECPEEKILVPIADLCPELTPECTTAETCIVIEDLEAGTTYYWQVRACLGHPTLSKWSVERTFLTALGIPEVISPACGADSVIISPSFNWTAVTGATSYDIELATTETFTTGVIRGSSTVNAWVIAEPLEYATTYYWRVRAQADGVYSDWVVSIFTTAAKPVPAPPPVVVEPTPPAPVVPAPIIEFPPTPSWVWAIIGIGAALAVVVIVLIVRTRRPPA